MDFEALEKELGEVNMALVTGIVMVMYGSIYAGASKDGFMKLFAEHEQNFAARGQQLASKMMTAFRLMANSAKLGN